MIRPIHGSELLPSTRVVFMMPSMLKPWRTLGRRLSSRVKWNEANLAKVRKLFKKSTEQEYDHGYLAGYTGQDHHDRWDSSHPLAEIRKVGLPVPSSLVTNVVELVISEGERVLF
ncbi:hypothetical protein C1H46_003858 [Malus baccata]|uniref:Uncharacterized protein n=1 Tax=Malus baccata TaxID=106549 RepID=A0A540NJ63_MALBA|nr:hypothetical protein C1H46_003858 [Malus baccata]